MSTQQQDKKHDKDQEKPALPPDPETLHKTDPQENMEGPISSMIQGIKEDAEKNDEESKEDADEKKEQNT